MRLTVLVLVVLFSASAARAEEAAAAYGYLSKVVLEPVGDKPERIQVWGMFSVSAGASGDYQAPERGYLYFEIGRDSQIALRDWNELKRIWEAGSPLVNRVGGTIKGIVAFGQPGMRVRVRTSDEVPGNPDSYSAGRPVATVGYDDPSPAVFMLGQTPLGLPRYNYVRIDRVVLEPDANSPQRIQIWGAFVMGNANDGFAAPQNGYLYLTLPSNPQAFITDWAAASNPVVQGFYVMTYMNKEIRVRPPGESPAAPDSYEPVLKDTSRVRTDTEFAPVKALRAR